LLSLDSTCKADTCGLFLGAKNNPEWGMARCVKLSNKCSHENEKNKGACNICLDLLQKARLVLSLHSHLKHSPG